MSKNFAVVFAAIFILVALGIFIYEQAPFGSIRIKPDGSVVGTFNIHRDGDLYTFTGNISDAIVVQKSNIVIDGAGFTLEGNGEGIGLGLDRSQNVTVENLRIIHWEYGINCANNNNTFIGNYLANCGFQIIGSNNTLKHNTLSSILILYSGVNAITENNFITSVPIFVGDECSNQMVDRNYWSDYTTKYPNAKKIDNTGIWDTPYTQDDYGGRSYTDDHPLIESVPVIEPTLGVAPTTTMLLPIAASLVAVVIVGAGLLVYFKKLKRKAT
jgi:hypothetical protein